DLRFDGELPGEALADGDGAHGRRRRGGGLGPRVSSHALPHAALVGFHARIKRHELGTRVSRIGRFVGGPSSYGSKARSMALRIPLRTAAVFVVFSPIAQSRARSASHLSWRFVGHRSTAVRIVSSSIPISTSGNVSLMTLRTTRTWKTTSGTRRAVAVDAVASAETRTR